MAVYLTTSTPLGHPGPSTGGVNGTAPRRAPDEGMEPDLEIWFDSSTPVPSLRAAGGLDARTAPALLGSVIELLAAGGTEVAIDIGRLEVCDQEGNLSLHRIQRLLRQSGVKATWRGMPAAVRERAPGRPGGAVAGRGAPAPGPSDSAAPGSSASTLPVAG